MADTPQSDEVTAEDAKPRPAKVRRRTNRVTLFALIGIAVIGALLVTLNSLQLAGYLPSISSKQAQIDQKGFLLDEFGDPSILTEEDDSDLEIDSPDFSLDLPTPLPPQESQQSHLVKPGHWLTTKTRIQANNFDFTGKFQAIITSGDGTPYPVDKTPYLLPSNRLVPLTSGRPKEIPLTLYIPADRGTDVAAGIPPRMLTSLISRNRSAPVTIRATRLAEMPPHQYFFVVLAREQARYTFLRTLDAIKSPYDGLSGRDDSEDVIHYQVVQPDCDQEIPLAENVLTWSSIAYILWDEVNPQLFTQAQQKALIDWLHWGGQLIVNGPDSLDELSTSFLAPHLPATSDGSWMITGEDPAIAALDQFWTRHPKSGSDPKRSLQVRQPWSAIKLKVTPAASLAGDKSRMFAERRVGRGRIIVSAIQLSERDLVSWQGGYSNLINGLLLRRPPRIHLAGSFGDMTTTWASPKFREHRYDSSLTTQFFIFARDANVPTHYMPPRLDLGTIALPRSQFGTPSSPKNRLTPPDASIAARPPDTTTSRIGRGGWNSDSPVAQAARDILHEEAGIEVPSTTFVAISVILYMLVLVPLNWLFFRALGKVEYAWLAAPIIAIVASLLIVQQAQLDIGFARAQTEVAILELQPRHTRGHLSRYTALYTSLASSYEMRLDDASALVLPLQHQGSSAESRRLQPLSLTTKDDVALTGLSVPSAATEFVHSEQMWDLQQAIQLGKSSIGHPQLENRSSLELKNAYIVYKPANASELPGGSNCQAFWIGNLAGGESRALSLVPMIATEEATWFEAERATASLGSRTVVPVDLAKLEKLSSRLESLLPGETRLIARVDGILPGTEVVPAASQQRGATLILAHLDYTTFPTPTSDWNSPDDVKKRP